MKIAVTGAFGYSGQYIATRLLDAGHEVLTLTNSPHRAHPFGERVRSYPLCFDRPDDLAHSLDGVDALINTYWVRFDHRLFNHDEAVHNTKILFGAAKVAGVGRIVHVSITNPDAESNLPYFKGKAELEAALLELRIPFRILRPTVLFGKEDILINNIAWALRRLPVFGMFGDGAYKLQPIYVDDLAAAAVEGVSGTGNETIDAIGPETFTYRELVVAIGSAIGVSKPILALPPGLALAACSAMGRWVHDVVITREEIQGLMEGRLFVDSPPLGSTKLTDWVRANKDSVGQSYSSEMRRRVDRSAAYRSA